MTFFKINKKTNIMTKRNWIITIVLILIVSTNTITAQMGEVKKENAAVKNTDPLKGLKKASFKDIKSNGPIMINPKTTPTYSEDHVLLNEQDFGEKMSSGDYELDPYADDRMELKAFVLRKATEEEKEMFKQRKKKREEARIASEALIGKEAMPFSVTDILGKKYSLADLKGKVIVMNFWFVECKPCLMEIPELNELVEKYKNKEVVFLGFSTNPKSKIDEFLKTKTFKYNIIADSKNKADLYNVYSFPTHIIIDKESKIAHYASGFGPTTIEDLDKMIEKLLNK